MRRMSVALTAPQVRTRVKTVTRRFGWWKLKPGTLLALCEKTMGFRKGEKAPEPIAVVEVVSTRREPVNAIDAEDVVREGFSGQTPAWFVSMLCEHAGRRPEEECNRIEFRYVDLVPGYGWNPEGWRPRVRASSAVEARR